MKLRRSCLSRDEFIIYLDEFEYDVEESECEPFIPLKAFYPFYPFEYDVE